MAHRLVLPKHMRLHLVTLDEQVTLPSQVGDLGARPALYYRALSTLIAKGSWEAKFARKIFDRKARLASLMPQEQARVLITLPDVSPVDLHWQTQWKMDLLGMTALQTLLWLWAARLQTQRTYWFSKEAKGLPEFNRHTSNPPETSVCDQSKPDNWWLYAKDLLWVVSPELDEETCFQRLIPPSRRNSSTDRHKTIVDKLRRRFCSFARPPS